MEKERDFWSKLDLVIKGISGILIPLAIFWAGYHIASQQKNIEVSRHNIDQMGLLLKHMVSENEQERLLTVKLMEHYASADISSKGLVYTLIDIIKGDNSPEVVKAATEAVGSATKDRPDLLRKVNQMLPDIPPRVYIHIPKDSQSSQAKAIVEGLEKEGYVVPAIEKTKGMNLSITELRYYRKAEAEEALKIVNSLKVMKVNVRLVDRSSENENSQNIRARHYELWFAGK